MQTSAFIFKKKQTFMNVIKKMTLVLLNTVDFAACTFETLNSPGKCLIHHPEYEVNEHYAGHDGSIGSAIYSFHIKGNVLHVLDLKDFNFRVEKYHPCQLIFKISNSLRS